MTDKCTCGRETKLDIPGCVDCGDVAAFAIDGDAFCYAHGCDYLIEQYTDMGGPAEEACCIECDKDTEHCECEEICDLCDLPDSECECFCDSCGCNCSNEQDCCLEGFDCDCGCNSDE